MRCVEGLLVGIACVAAAASAAPAGVDDIARLRSLYEHRADGFDGRWASPEPIAASVAAAEEALAADPQSLPLRIELLRSLYFEIDFVELSKGDRAALSERSIAVLEAGLEQIHGRSDFDGVKPEDLAAEAGEIDGAGALHFWAAVHWGLFGQAKSAMAAVRQGVAKRVREHSEVAILLAPDYDAGGPYRILGRLHAIAPRVPLVTGWVRRQRAVELLEEAYRRDPTDPLNRLFLAEAWIDEVPERRAEAKAMLEALAAEEPRPDKLVEDSRALDDARLSLAKLR